MALQVVREEVEALGLDLPREVASFRQALEAHAATQGEPAPIAHPLVEELVRQHDGVFAMVDRVDLLSPDALRAELARQVSEIIQARSDMVASPARLRLAHIDAALLSQKVAPLTDGQPLKGVAYRTQAEQERFDEIILLFDRLTQIQRHGAVLMIELEDLAADQLKLWQPVGWPTFANG